MVETEGVCSVCAWRETCQKKFSLSGRDVSCADFTRDMKVAETEGEKDEPRSEPEK